MMMSHINIHVLGYEDNCHMMIIFISAYLDNDDNDCHSTLAKSLDYHEFSNYTVHTTGCCHAVFIT